MSTLRVKRIVVGPTATNTYLAWHGSKAVIIDPAWPQGIEPIVRLVRELGLEVVMVVATHGHFDHVLGYKRLAGLLGYSPPFAAHPRDWRLLVDARKHAVKLLGTDPRVDAPEIDEDLEEGYTIRLGRAKLTVIETPGHTPGSITLVSEGIAFTGDTLLRGTIGIMGHPGENPSILVDSVLRLLELPDDTIVYPGHGAKTTIGRERGGNLHISYILSLIAEQEA